MQNTAHTKSTSSRNLTLCLAAACAGLGIYAVTLRSDLTALRGELDAARAEREGARRSAEVVRGQLTPLQENVARLTAERDQLRTGTPTGGSTTETTTATAQETANPLAMFSQAFAAPEMRQMVRREALSDARKGYADVLQKWNLSPAEADQFLQFVADRDSAEASDALALLASGKLDEKSIAEQEANAEKSRQESSARLKALLGDERFAEFEAEEARTAEKKAISPYRDHLESAGVPLSRDQRYALAKLVTKEKPDENSWQPEDVEFVTQGMTDAQILKMRQRQEAGHTRITQQATAFLSPDQVEALQGAFRTELEEQDLALKMARALFQPSAPAQK
jgi:hypothetical protein